MEAHFRHSSNSQWEGRKRASDTVWKSEKKILYLIFVDFFYLLVKRWPWAIFFRGLPVICRQNNILFIPLSVCAALYPWKQPGPVHHGNLHCHVASYPLIASPLVIGCSWLFTIFCDCFFYVCWNPCPFPTKLNLIVCHYTWEYLVKILDRGVLARLKTHWMFVNPVFCTNDLGATKLGVLMYNYWAVQWSWFAWVNSLCNLLCKKSQHHFLADFWGGVASHYV